MRIDDIIALKEKADKKDKPEKKSSPGSEIRLPKLKKGDQIWFSDDIEDHATITGQTKDPLTKQPKLKTSRGERKIFTFNIPKHKITDSADLDSVLRAILESVPPGQRRTTDLRINDDEIEGVIDGTCHFSVSRPIDPNNPEDMAAVKRRMATIDELSPDQRRFIHQFGLTAFLKLLSDYGSKEWEAAEARAKAKGAIKESRRAKPARVETLRPSSLLPLAKACAAKANSPFWDFKETTDWAKQYTKIVADHRDAADRAAKHGGDGFFESAMRMKIAERVRGMNDVLFRAESEINERISEYQTVMADGTINPHAMIHDSEYLRAMAEQKRIAAVLQHVGHFDATLQGMHTALVALDKFFDTFRAAHENHSYAPELAPALQSYLEGFLPFCVFLFGK